MINYINNVMYIKLEHCAMFGDFQ